MSSNQYVGRFEGTNALERRGGQSDPKASSNLETAVRWSTLSERLNGLLREAHTINAGMEDYCQGMSTMEGPAMRAIRDKMLQTPWKEEWCAGRTLFAYGEEMSTDPLEAQFLKALSSMKRPNRVLEIGMFTGYGAVAVLEGCEHAEVVSLEIDPYLKSWVADCLTRFPNVGKRHRVVTGPALDTLEQLDPSEKFDLVFVDANKAEYRRYVELLTSRNLLAENASIVADNTLYCGMPFTPPAYDSQPKRRGFGDAIRDFNGWVASHDCLEQVVLPLRDGVSMISYHPRRAKL